MTSWPRFPEFKLVGLEDKGPIEDFFHRFPPQVCELNFPNIFIWRHSEHPKWTTIHDNFCLLCEPVGEPAYFLPPLGDRLIRETIEICLDFSLRLSRVPEDYVKKWGQELAQRPDRDNFDYVYRTSDLVHLQGKKYDGKRNRIRKLERNYRYQYVPLAKENLDRCERLFEEWVKRKAEESKPIGHDQITAIAEAIGHFEELELVGGAIEVEGRLEAFSIGSRLSPDTAVIHIEIANSAYDGLSQLINREFARHTWSNFRFINREQDMGVPGLRRAKMSYHPHHLVKKYDVWEIPT